VRTQIDKRLRHYDSSISAGSVDLYVTLREGTIGVLAINLPDNIQSIQGEAFENAAEADRLP
jgi:hypothetical protein